MKTARPYAAILFAAAALAALPLGAQDKLPGLGAFESWSASDGLPSDKAMAVLATRRGVWAGTERGLARFVKGRWTPVPIGDDPARRVITCLAADPVDGAIWAGTFQGVVRISAGRVEGFTQLDSGLPNDVVYGVAADDAGVWVATASGLGWRDRRSGSWKLFDHTNTLMHEPWCYSIAESPRRVFVGVWGGGIVEHDTRLGTWKEHRDPDGEMELDLLADDGPVHDVTSSVSFDQGLLWQGTYFGLSRYDGRRWRTWVEASSGLSSNFINYVHARGRFAWIATDRGLCVTDGDDWATWRRQPDGSGVLLKQRANGKSLRSTTRSALPHEDVQGLSAFGDTLWIATSKGVARATITDVDRR